MLAIRDLIALLLRSLFWCGRRGRFFARGSVGIPAGLSSSAVVGAWASSLYLCGGGLDVEAASCTSVYTTEAESHRQPRLTWLFNGENVSFYDRTNLDVLSFESPEYSIQMVLRSSLSEARVAAVQRLRFPSRQVSELQTWL